jgi:DNA-binding transcriptional MocR family regulator
MTLYRDIAMRITTRIEQGLYKPGDRLPGVRPLSEQFGVSVSTVVQAQRHLENQGAIEARPRSGYYICQRAWLKPEVPSLTQPPQRPMPVTGQELVLQLARAANQTDFVQFGAAVPHAAFLPLRALQRSLGKAARSYQQYANYAFPPGLAEIRQHVARRMLINGDAVHPDDIVITDGCQEAVALALRAVAKAGDVIAIESPTFYGLLQVIDSLGMKALEIPTDPQHGISLAALQMAAEQWPVKACVSIPNFSNPMGARMSDDNKLALVRLARQHRFALIEDDLYGDLSFAGDRPRSLKSFADDPQDQVYYCSSFSKTVSPGLRCGWVHAPQATTERIMYLKHVSNLATNSLAQVALADYLQQGNHERYLRQVQGQYRLQVAMFSQAISKYFPPGTRVTQPAGGFVLWVELDPLIDTLALTHRAIEQKISIAPGQIFSASQKYRNCIRLNCAQPWSARLDAALMELGRQVQVMLQLATR